ncbi:MAG: YheT family hydrolase [Cyanobium sp.]
MSQLLHLLELAPFRQRFPWLGPDLQTLRNTLRAAKPQPETGQTLEFQLPTGGRLLARLDFPGLGAPPRGLIVVVHGMGGCSDDGSQRRLGRALNREGFASLRLNLRGAGPGRTLAKGTYAARCSSDLLPVLKECRRLALGLSPSGRALPLGAVGLSLGGTILLNALLDGDGLSRPVLEGLVCLSSPLDLLRCAEQIERPRNLVYRQWLVRRLIRQTLGDPFGLTEEEHRGLRGPNRPRTIREFDDLITAPRWGFAGVEAYYNACSPLPRLRKTLFGMPPLLLVHAKDDPWVPVEAATQLAAEIGALKNRSDADPRPCPWPDVVITEGGGHNGFHAPGDSGEGCWSDRLAALWLRQVLMQTAAT